MIERRCLLDNRTFVYVVIQAIIEWKMKIVDFKLNRRNWTTNAFEWNVRANALAMNSARVDFGRAEIIKRLLLSANIIIAIISND